MDFINFGSMRVFFQNFSQKTGVPINKPLEGSVEQVLEIFSTLPENDGSFIGLITEKKQSVQFTKYNRFVWLVEVPSKKKKGTYQMFLTKQKCKLLIQDLFNGLNPLKINGLRFDKF